MSRSSELFDRLVWGHHSVRTLGIRFTIPAENVDTNALEQRKAALYEAINRYAEQFAATENGGCVCGVRLGGLLGMFTYGIAHGEGRCSACGHPARANHYVAVAGTPKAFSWVQPLPYHPDLVEAAS